jgi:hypothetical protein
MTELLSRKIDSCFGSPTDQADAQAILSRIPNSSERVGLAVLKLAGGSIERLRHFVDAAVADFRDVIAWAESPRESDLSPSCDQAARARAQAEDKNSYQAWLDA